jgi:6-phosphogluconolactonase
MANFELISFPNDLALAQAVANDWLSALEAANRTGASQFVALSGGRIARRFFISVAEMAKARTASLARVHFFWADERCVPPTDPESNFALANEHLFEPLNITPEHIHRIPGELSPPRAVVLAIAELSQFVPCNLAGQPVLDIVFLGQGEDGHVASLFPGEPEAVKTDRSIYRAVTASKPPPRRITTGYGTIAAARQVWVLASGAGKEAALRDSLAAEGQTPLARVIKLRMHTKIFTDVFCAKANLPLQSR